MDVLKLTYFLSVAKHLSFTKAAQENFVAQPVISRSISDLEYEIGCKLFSRSSRGVYLTASGKSLVPKVEEALSILQDSFEYARKVQSGVSGSFSIGALTPATLVFLPSLIAEFSAQNPNIEITVDRMVPSVLQSAMESGSHDLYISMQYNADHCPQYKYHAIRRSELVFITRNTVRDLDMDGIRECARSNELLLMPEDDSPFTNQLVQSYVKQKHITHNGIRYVRPIESLFYNISSGLGVAVLPRNIVQLEAFNLRSHPLPDAPYTEIGLAWLDEINPAAQNFIDFMDSKEMFLK